MGFRFLYHSESEPMQMDCPKCGSPDKRHSNSERFFDAFWRALGYTPYRCRSCRARYFRREQEKKADLKERTAQ
jgi:transposase-like protein